MGTGVSTQAGKQRGGGGVAAKDSGESQTNKFSVTDLDPMVHKTLMMSGVGLVVSPETILSAGAIPRPQDPTVTAAGGLLPPHEQQQQYRWFAEDLDRVGQWEPYNTESSQRLESAFMARKESCLVTLRKRAYTVDLLNMQQLPDGTSGAQAGAGGGPGLPQQRVRRVRRAPAKVAVNPSTGAEEVEMLADTLVDPFTDDAQVGEGDAGAAGDGEANYRASQSADAAFPRLEKLTYPSKLPLYSLDVSPAGDWVSPEARAVGVGGASEGGGVHILSGGKDGRLTQWDTTTGNIIARYAITAARPTSVLVARFSPTARLVACGCDDNNARIYRVGQPNPVYMLKGHTHKVYGVSVLAGESRLVTGSMDAHVRVWDLETGVSVRSEQCHNSHVFATTASLYDPNFCLTAGNDAILCAHDLRSPSSVVMRLKGHTATLWDCAMFPGDGGHNTQLASAGMDATVRLWDPRQPEEPLQIIRGSAKPVHSIAYMPCGRGILSSSKDAHMMLSNTTTGAMVWRAKAQVSSVFRVLYHPERKTIFTSGISGLVSQWAWPAGDTW